MLRLILGLILALLGSSAWGDCEERLYHHVTQATLKLLAKGVLSRSDVRAMADSEVPLSPVRARTPLARDASAVRFFQLALLSNLDEAWPRIRAELSSGLRQVENNVDVEEKAKVETEAFANISEVSSPTHPGKIDSWGTVAGKVYYSKLDGESLSFYDLWSKSPLFTTELSREVHETRYSLAANGHPMVRLYFFNQMQRQSWWGRKEAVQMNVRTIDLLARATEEKQMVVPVPKDSNPRFERFIDSRIEPRPVVDPEILKQLPHFGSSQDAKELMTHNHRHLISVTSYGGMSINYLRIYEPARGLKPIVKIMLSNDGMHQAEIFEYENRVYAVTVTPEDPSKISLYDVDAGDIPLATAKAPVVANFILEQTDDGNVYLALSGQDLRIFSLFARDRGQR